MDKIKRCLTAPLELLLVLPTHLLCWTLSWLGILDGASDRSRPSFTKALAALTFALVAGLNVTRLFHGVFTGPTSQECALVVIALAAAFGRGTFRRALERNTYSFSGATNAQLNADIHGDLAEVIRAWREDPETQEDREHEEVR